MQQGLGTLLERVTNSHPRTAAIAGCLLCTGTYVGLLYLWRGMPRNHPSTIRRRMLSVGAACSVAWVPLRLALPKGAELHKVLGLTAAGLPAAATQPLALTATFFAGPLLFRLLDPATCRAASSVLEAGQNMLRIALQPGQWSRAAAALSQQALGDESLVLWRNLVVAPVAEEFVFRACMAPLLLLKGFSFTSTVFITPLFFGAAHLHHLHDLVHYQRVSPARAAAQVAFQFTYTTIFGWFETLVFLRTRSLLAPVLVHSFCNWMGVPDINYMSRQAGGRVALPLLAMAGGVVGFAALFRPLMQPSNYGSG